MLPSAAAESPHCDFLTSPAAFSIVPIQIWPRMDLRPEHLHVMQQTSNVVLVLVVTHWNSTGLRTPLGKHFDGLSNFHAERILNVVQIPGGCIRSRYLVGRPLTLIMNIM